MKHLKFVLFLLINVILLCSCDNSNQNDNENNHSSNFSISASAADRENISISIYLFKSKDIEFSDIQNIDKLKAHTGIDINGDEHHSFYSLGVDQNTIKCDLLSDEYFLVLVINETGRYSTCQLNIEPNKTYQLNKKFLSSTPENSYERWD
jgi:hypothetical protein